jgi:queuine tRNA-ribosyltransferase
MSKAAVTYELIASDGKARRGRINTPHGSVETPTFMPVGTVGSVKGLAPWELKAMGAGIVLGNTYHLHLRPSEGLIERRGGLHRFVAWDGPMLTDSGGFQVFSLAKLNKITEEGVAFRSHIDGSKRFLSPEESMRIQKSLGADIVMAFDQCPPADAPRSAIEAAMARTTRWLDRCMTALDSSQQALFGIVQGGVDVDLRRQHIDEICSRDLPGFALGGLSVGETSEQMYETLEASASLLPIDKPRYLMGVGTPRDLVEAVAQGIDMFDCVLPTRNGRMGTAMTSEGRINIKNARFAEDDGPLDPTCLCPTCTTFSRAYLRHLFMAKEILVMRALSEHNLWYLMTLMGRCREAIEKGSFAQLLAEVRERWPSKAERSSV